MSYPNNILKAAALLEDVKAEISKLLEASEHSHIAISVTNSLDTIANRLYFLGGGQAPNQDKVEFPPITNFMGEDITVPQPVKQEDLEPSEVERAIFLDKVNRLFDLIDTISPDGVLNDYRIPEDQLVLRGVAKKAGVEGYQERELNVAFVEAIVAAKKAREKTDLEQKRIEAELAKQDKITDLNRRKSEAELRISSIEEDIQVTKLDLEKAAKKDKPNLEKALEALEADLAEGQNLLKQLEAELADLNQQ